MAVAGQGPVGADENVLAGLCGILMAPEQAQTKLKNPVLVKLDDFLKCRKVSGCRLRNPATFDAVLKRRISPVAFISMLREQAQAMAEINGVRKCCHGSIREVSGPGRDRDEPSCRKSGRG